ncbi:condensation domain-containing protein [Corallococcus carmarthensis]|uniref:Carrier domain-containing protein n=1 Tax=Corallococcus carmarthensis TaxID=2316728 RepID=A0A3A8KZG9_9BACT|nr:condensation domain-containing protein [Corallococcus carmarthensis]RKH07394.1 hypothetical protein D7X32_02160 [Corallococcus carmarthensis]
MSTDTAQRLATLCKEILRIDHVRPEASLVLQGASSMRLMQLVARLYEDFDVIVDLSEVMGEVTLDWIAAMVEERRAADGGGAAPTPALAEEARRPAGGPVPLSELQLAFWEMRRYAPAMAAYNEGVSHLVKGDLDLAVCKKVLVELVALQPALRNAYLEVDGVPVQREVPMAEIESSLKLEVTDLSAHPDPMAECAAQHRAMYATRFDLSAPPCFRVAVWKVGERRWVVSWVVYHIVTDWWAVDVLRRGAAKLYRALMAAGVPESRPSAVPQDPHAGTRFTADDEAWWLAKFQTPPRPLTLSSRPRPLIKSYAGEMYLQELQGISASRMEGLRERLAVTMSSLTYAAFSLLLAALSGEDDVTVGVPFLNRQHADVQDTVGLFVNSLPVRMKAEHGVAAGDYIRACHGELLEAFRHGRYPSFRLMRQLKLPTRFNRAPLYDHLFSYYENTVVDVVCDQTKLAVTEIELPRGTSKYDLSLFVTRTGDRLDCKAEYTTALFSQEETAAFVSHYQALLERLLTDSSVTVGELLATVRARVQHSLPQQRA